MTTPTSRTGATKAAEPHGVPAGQAGFTLIELGLVMLLLGITMLLVIPNLFRAGSGLDEFQRLSLWTEVVLERTAFRREVLLIEVDPREGVLRLVQPRRVMPQVADDTESARAGEEASELLEVQDPYVPARFEFPARWRILDVQGPDGVKFSDEPYLVIVYPGGWIDPVTFHLVDPDRSEWTGFVNPVTGRIRWVEGYSERVRDGGSI